MNLPIPSTTDKASEELGPLEKLKGKAFEKAYLVNAVSQHSEYLSLLKDKVVPAANSPIVKKILESFFSRIITLLETAKGLNK